MKKSMVVAGLAVISLLICTRAESPAPELLVVVKDGKAGFINRSGKIVIEPQFAKANDFSEGLAAAWESVPEWMFPVAGFIDASGKWVIKPQFSKAGSFHEGYATAQLMDKFGTWVLVSRSGAVARVPASEVTPVSMSIGDVSEGLAAFSPNGEKYGFMKPNASLAVPPIYDRVRSFHEGLANVCKEKCGYVDSIGDLVIPLIYSASSDFHHDRARACDDSRCGYVAKDGTFTQSPDVFRVPDSFGERMVEYSADGLHAFCKDGLCGYVDDKGQIAIKPQFKRADEFAESLAAVIVDEYGTCGYIDKTGKFVIPATFSSCDTFTNGLAAVDQMNKSQGTKMGYIDKSGKFIWFSLE
jgi:WG containing repeat